MKAKSLLLNILFFILIAIFLGCENESVNENLGFDNNVLELEDDLQMIGKKEIEEPDDR